MSTKVPYGKPVKFLVDYQGYPDGRLIVFEIWRQKSGREEKIGEVNGVTKDGKGTGFWIPEFKERKEVLPLQKQVPEEGIEKYYFKANIDDKSVKSTDFVFTYPLQILLKGKGGEPINGAKCTLTFFSDKSQIKTVSKDGYVSVADAPSGKFKIELEEYEFV